MIDTLNRGTRGEAGADGISNYRRLLRQFRRLSRRCARAEKAPERALADARRLLLAGQNPAPAELRYREALVERELLTNRLAALAIAVRMARKSCARAANRRAPRRMMR